MAIDTAQKRRSSGLVGLPFKLGTVVPQGGSDPSQRVAAGWYYSGIVSETALSRYYDLTAYVAYENRTVKVPSE